VPSERNKSHIVNDIVKNIDCFTGFSLLGNVLDFGFIVTSETILTLRVNFLIINGIIPNSSFIVKFMAFCKSMS
jgi:hypothetical protein